MADVGTVIVGYDGPEHGKDALALGRELATGGRMIVAEAFPRGRRGGPRDQTPPRRGGRGAR